MWSLNTNYMSLFQTLLHYQGEEHLHRVINFALKYMSELQLPAKRYETVSLKSISQTDLR